MEINKIYQGNSLDVLKTFHDNCIDCCITSPPYYNLRDYNTSGQIWDSVNGCQHDWIDNTYVRNTDLTADKLQQGNKGAIGRDNPVNNAFCSKCGAWYGELGLEPTPELYIKHLVQIFSEVKRLLKNDGTLWVNIGDSYAGGGGASGHTENTQNLGRKTDRKSVV